MEETVPTSNKPSKKRLIIFLVLILFVLIAGLLLISGYQRGNMPKTPSSSQTVNAEIRLSFIPNTLYAKPDQKVASDIVFNAGDVAVQSVTVSVSYDPTKIKDVKVTPYSDPNSALSYSLVALPVVETSSSEGLTVITYKLVSQGAPQKGQGIIAKFEGTLISAPTNVNFDQTSSAVSSESNTNLSVGMVNLNIFPSAN